MSWTHAVTLLNRPRATRASFPYKGKTTAEKAIGSNYVGYTKNLSAKLPVTVP